MIYTDIIEKMACIQKIEQFFKLLSFHREFIFIQFKNFEKILNININIFLT
jgi:hypothetical protein